MLSKFYVQEWRLVERAGLLCCAFILFSTMAQPAFGQDKIDGKLGTTPLDEDDAVPQPGTGRSLFEVPFLPDILDSPMDVFRALLADRYRTEIAGMAIHAGVSGRLNPALLFGDNGERNDKMIVDNNNAASRFVGVMEAIYSKNLIIGGRLEIPFSINNSLDVDFGHSDKNLNFNDREEKEIVGYVESRSYGRLSFGHAGTASDGTAESDLSGTIVISRSRVRDLAGGLSFRNDGPQIRNVFHNYDGLEKTTRLRYDSPAFSHIVLSTSLTTTGKVDLAFRWRPVVVDRRIAVAGSIANIEDGVQASISASMLWPSGFNLTGTLSGRDVDEVSPLFVYGKIGWLGRPIDLGPSAVALDVAYNRDSIARGDEGFSFGGFIVQTIEHDGIVSGVDLYAGVRMHYYETDMQDFGDILATMVGFRVRF